MSNRSIRGTRRLGLAATVAFGATVAGPAVTSASASTAGSATVEDGTLTVVGTNGNDQLALRLAIGDPNTLQIDMGDDGTVENRFDRTTFSSIVVELRSGDDRFRVDQSGGAFADEALTVDAGAGNDTVIGGDGNELTLGGSGDDVVDGNRGVDTALLGSGNDSFTWDPGDGSDDVDGDAGRDTLRFFGSNAGEEMALTANGRRAVFLRNLGTIRMDMDAIEQLDVFALGGADIVRIDDMTGTDVDRANVSLAGTLGSGDAATDVVTVTGSPKRDRVAVHATAAGVDIDGLRSATRITGSETADVLNVDTGDGEDTVTVDDDVAALIGVVVDLGDDQA
jgi:Ca2+-binding RTX toxin-like protein